MRRKETAMYTQWIENLVVQRLSLHGGLVLDFDDYNEIVISCPLLLTLPAVGTYPIEAVRIDPLRIATHERPGRTAHDESVRTRIRRVHRIRRRDH